MLTSYDESYGRFRISRSPLSSLKAPALNPPVLKSPVLNSNQEKDNLKMPLTPENYRYIQTSIAGIILQIRLFNKTADLSEICEIISSEAQAMESVGVEYINEYLRTSELPGIFKELKELKKDANNKT